MATLLLTAGGDLYTVGKLLGHTNINTTQVYADVLMETKIDAVNRISEFFKPIYTNLLHLPPRTLNVQPLHFLNSWLK